MKEGIEETGREKKKILCHNLKIKLERLSLTMKLKLVIHYVY